jgi:hypothetical protein
MYSLFSNEKLGMPVEKVRLEEIRQLVQGQYLADELKTANSKPAANTVKRLLATLWRGHSRAEQRDEPLLTPSQNKMEHVS